MQTVQPTGPRPGGRVYGLYLGLITLLVAVITLGYFGFRHFATVVMPQMGAFNLLALALIAGVASFFSPCAFPLLPSYPLSLRPGLYCRRDGLHRPDPGRSGRLRSLPWRLRRSVDGVRYFCPDK